MSVAVVAGASQGLGSALCRAFAAQGLQVVALARNPEPDETWGPDVLPMRCDITQPEQVTDTLAKVERARGPIEVLVHNAAAFSHGPFLQVELADFEQAWATSARGAFVLAQAVLPAMLQRGRGTLLFGGATASRRGSSKFASLAASKFALRGLAQSLAREFGPQGVHVAHVVLDGVIWCDWTQERFAVVEDRSLDADAIAEAYVQLHAQRRRAWTHELDLRPAGESF